jgi:23S rRNA pseudouridine2605 synthase
MHEGRKRQIREVGTRLGLPVVKIIRIRIGTLMLGNLMPREWRHLSAAEVAALRKPTASKGKPDQDRHQAKKQGETSRSQRPSGQGKPK